ncbi:DUF305 domain-containing protein [Rhodococcus sp. IEGM 1366]|uniref:DUF305 domain-containing protein n=1 Tax=Rhodococcus sp. IEGM 1366 TaxID=3082223 RepID=UPI002952F23D|nr:DUF305 domain-containing protein [Rhodococcus sp. IEGM 1366]MDV8070679.1 DUF305 domain-containing protein [Rhodococcus sp. IEGM 1366]
MTCLGLAATAIMFLAIGAGLRPYFLPMSTPIHVSLSDTEIGFIQDMGAHHQQALFMVERLEPDIDPAVHRLGRQIESTQRTEVGTLQGWLRLVNAPMTNPHPMGWMEPDATDNSAGHQHRETAESGGPTLVKMPGMATWTELDQLGRSRGPDAEVLFLQLMLRHHKGGVEMAQNFVRQQQSGPVHEAAQGMIQDQGQEIAVMSMLLEQRQSLPMPYP